MKSVADPVPHNTQIQAAPHSSNTRIHYQDPFAEVFEPRYRDRFRWY
jgi:hypothetical protein